MREIDKLLEFVGHALPDTPSVFRFKVAFGGLCGVGGGSLYMMTGLDGSLAWGGLIVACGVTLIGLTVRSFAREEALRVAERAAAQRRQEEEGRRRQERVARERGCEHEWILDDQALNYDVLEMRCRKCGAVRAG